MSKPKYFLYARKSTEEDDRQVMSIEAQLFELREFARRENLKILTEFQESKSAKTPGRDSFNEMLLRIESGEANGILAWHPDRLARNSIDGGRVIYAVDTEKLVSLRFPTFWFEPTPQGLFMLQVAFGQSKYYSDNLVENIKRGVRQKLRRGEWLNFAPFGYVNNPRTKNIEPHPTNSRIVVRAFEEYAKGTHTYGSLAQFLAELGVLNRNQKPLAKATVAKILADRVYLGFVKHKGEYYQGSFVAIVPSKLFEAVQKVLRTKARPRKTKTGHNFPFTGVFSCGECGCMVTAQWATGCTGIRYRYYRCTKKKEKCSQGYVREDVLVAQLQKQLQTISLCDRHTDWMLSEIDNWQKVDVELSQRSEQKLSESIKAAEARMEKLVSLYLDEEIPRGAYLKRKDTIMRDLAALKEKKKDLARLGNNWLELLRDWILDIQQANFLSENFDFPKLKSFVQKIGTNHAVRDKTARFTPAPPWHFVATRRAFLSSAAASRRRGELLSTDEVRCCAWGRARTGDPFLFREMLYQLSYPSKFCTHSLQ